MDLATILAVLPRLTGDEVSRLYDAIPTTAAPWKKDYGGFYRMSLCGRFFRARVQKHWRTWTAETWEGGYEETPHPTVPAAQAACDARLLAADMKLCGEIVTTTEGADNG